MPRHFRTDRRRTRGGVTIRRPDGAVIEVVEPDELERRKAEAAWNEWRQRNGVDLYEEHRLLALQFGDVVTVPRYTLEVWWFVLDVNGLERTITAGTFLFDQPRERTFPFEIIEPLRLFHAAEKNDAARQFKLLRERVSPSEVRVGRDGRTVARPLERAA